MNSIIGLVVVLAVLAAIIAVPVLIIKAIINFIISLFKDDIETPAAKNAADEQFIVLSGNELYGITDKSDSTDPAEVMEAASENVTESAEEIVYSEPEKPCRKLSASEIMLLIGTAFIVLAALTFVAANWVNMEPAGRVLALLFGGALSFGISFAMDKAVKLERTSAAFYGIGSVVMAISFLTSGYYELFGSWFSLDGDGKWIFLTMFLGVISASAFISYPVYKKDASFIFGFGAAYFAVIPMCRQFGDGGIFAFALIMVQLILAYAVHILRIHSGMVFERQLGKVSKFFSVLYVLLSFNYVLTAVGDGSVFAYLITAAVLGQLVLYGILKKQKWMFVMANITALFADFMICCDTSEYMSDSESCLLFGIIAAVIYAVNRLVKGNLTVCRLISLCGLIIAAFIAMFGSSGDEMYVLIIPALAAVAVTEYVLHPSETVQKAAALAAPVIPFFMAKFIYENIDFIGSYSEHRDTYLLCQTFIFGGLALIYMAAAAFFNYLPKLSFTLHANHPRKTDLIFCTNMVCSGLVLLYLGCDHTNGFAVTMALCIGHFLLSGKLPNNITGAVSAAALALTTSKTVHSLFANDTVIYSRTAADYIMFAVLAAYVIAARFIYPNKLVTKRDGRTASDVITLAMPAFLFAYSFSGSTAAFLRIMTISVIAASAVKKDMNKKNAAILLSVSAAFAAIGLFNRPFLIAEDSYVTTKINMAIIALLGISYRFIWRGFPETAKKVSTFIFVGDFIWLIIDGLVDERAGNKIFVLTVTAVILILSFFLKSKTWFTSSSTALVVMTVISTWKYIDKAGWWLYLLIVGVVFVAIAAVNEACKKKGETVKSTVSKTFSDWTW